jgi:BRCT domain type II-containing protein
VEVDVSNHPRLAAGRYLQRLRRAAKDIAKLYGSYMPPKSLECLNEAVIELTGAIEYIERAEALSTAAAVDEVTT